MKPQRAAWTHTAKPFFLVGAPRSGTTWLQAMLGSHPEIYTGQETNFFATFASAEQSFLAPEGPFGSLLGLSTYLSREHLYEFFAELFWITVSSLAAPPRAIQYFLEKTPAHCFSARFILAVFPEARFIHLVRDSRSVVASMLTASQGWGAKWAPHTVDAACASWTLYVDAAHNIRNLVTEDGAFVEVRYEALRSNTLSELQALLQWLGLDPDALPAGVIETLSIESARQTNRLPGIARTALQGEAYPDGFIGSAPVSGEMAALTRLQRARVEWLTWPLLTKYGYTSGKPVITPVDRALMGRRVRSALKLRPL